MATTRSGSKGGLVRVAPAAERKGIQSVQVATRVLDVLARAPGALPLKEIGRLAAVSPSQTHRYLASFIKAGLVKQDPATGLYDLGGLVLTWGLAALSRSDVVESAADALKRLSSALDLTGLLCIWGERGPTCVRMRKGSTLIGTDVGLGSVFPLLGSATGHVFLAHLPEKLTRPYLQREATERRATGLTDPSPAEIATRVRASGYASAQRHLVSALSAFAAPVFDPQGDVGAVVSLIVPSAQFEQLEPSVAPALLRETQAASMRLQDAATPTRGETASPVVALRRQSKK